MNLRQSGTITILLVLVLQADVSFAQTPQEQFEGAQYLPRGAAPVLEKMPTATGAFTHSFPVQVPYFHEIAPSLSLSFSSRNAHNSFVGIGWTLSGLDVIERRGPNGSAATFTAADTYSYNGEPLVPFTGLGGTHATKRQSFLRIVQSGSNWIITEKNGTTKTLIPIHNTTRGTFRWGLSQVMDMNRNQVVYNWWSDGLDAYPDTITYNNNSITFGRETRSDINTFLTGGGIGKTNYRLKTITVVSASTALRTYTLSYDANAAGKSRLSQVDQTSLPSTTFGYNTDPSGPPPRFQAPVSSPPQGDSSFTLQEGDFNGDGRTDYCLFNRVNQTIYIYVSFSNGDGTFTTRPLWTWTAPYNISQWGIKFGDFRGDGKLDFLLHLTDNANFYYYVGLSNGDGTFFIPGLGSYSFPSLPDNPICRYATNYGVEVGDYNGDKKVDVRLHCRNGLAYPGVGTSYAYSYAFLSSGNGFFQTPPVFWQYAWQTPGSYSIWYYGIQPGDFDGDGNTDFRFHFRSGTTVWSYTVFSLGNGNFSNPVFFDGSMSSDVTGFENYGITSGDYNGDRQTDFRLYYRTASSLHSVTFLSNGRSGGYTPVAWRYYGSVDFTRYSGLDDQKGVCSTSNHTCAGSAKSCSTDADCNTINSPVAADCDGDGTSDIILNYRDSSGSYTYAAYSNGDGTFTTPALVQSAPGSFGNYGITAGDYNGDGRTDFNLIYRGAGLYSSAILAGIRKDYPPLLSRIGHWMGGSTSIEYNDHSSGKVLYRLTHADGLGGPSIVRTFAFTEPYITDPAEPRDIGFRQIRATDAASHYSDTYYYQGTGALVGSFPVGMTERVKRFNSSGNLMSENYFNVDTSGTTAPYVRLVTATDESECGAACSTLHTDIGYDSYGNVTAQTYQSGERRHSIIYNYDTTNYVVNRPTTDTVSGGVTSYTTTMAYDTLGNLTNKTVGGIATTKYEYDSVGNQTKVIDPRNYPTTIGFDNIYPNSKRNPLDQMTYQNWNHVYQEPSSSIDLNSRTTFYSYDSLGRKTLENRPDGSSTSIAYNNFGDPRYQSISAAISDGSFDGLWTKTYFDGLGRPYKEEKKTSWTPLTKTVAYDGRGLIASVTVDNVTTSFEYDGLGRRTLTRQPDFTLTSVSYDDWLRKVTSTDELRYTTTRTKDAYSNIIQIDDPAGTTYLAYDAANHLTHVTDALQYETSLSYDAAGRKTQVTDPDLGLWKYYYDATGNLTSQVDARNLTITFAYDPLNRLTNKAAGSTNLATLYYDQDGLGDSKGHLTKVTDRTGLTGYLYDVMGRVTQEVRVIDGHFYNLWKTYDLAGRPGTLTYPDGETISYAYDAGGHLTRVGNYATSGSYNVRGQLESRSLCNGVGETFGYHPTRDWLTSWNSTYVENLSIGHNDRGDVTALTGGTANWGYDYDGLGRMTAASDGPFSQIFSYGANSRMTSQSYIGNYTYSSRAHAPISVGSWALSYDANGNLTSGANHSYTYDEENHIANLDGVTVRYNGLGERVKAGDTIFVSNLYEDNGSTQRKYYYFGKSRIARRDNLNDVYYYHADQVGSVGRITDRQRNIVKERIISAFGHSVSESGTLSDPFALAGQRLENGLYSMGARYLDPELAMFVSPDLSDDADPKSPAKLNRYAYAYNAPTKFIDPSGHEGEAAEPIWESTPVDQPTFSSGVTCNAGGGGGPGCPSLGESNHVSEALEFASKANDVSDWFSSALETTKLTINFKHGLGGFTGLPRIYNNFYGNQWGALEGTLLNLRRAPLVVSRVKDLAEKAGGMLFKLDLAITATQYWHGDIGLGEAATDVGFSLASKYNLLGLGANVVYKGVKDFYPGAWEGYLNDQHDELIRNSRVNPRTSFLMGPQGLCAPGHQC